ncbi:MAG: AmmeMemoRadiSam system protein B, partial [Nanoarchaeota archaeon]
MTREPEFNGMFYPDDPKRLKNMIREFLENVPEPTLEDTTGLKAIIVPHAGYVFSGLTAAYAYKLIPRDTERIILIGPSHRYPIQGPVASDENWKTPLGEIKGEALDSTGMTIDNRAHRGEHSLEVQLPFLQMILDNDFTIMPIAVNRSDTEGTARLLLEHLDDNT